MDVGIEYTATRVKGMKSKLLSEAKLRQLLEVKSINEMIQLLEETDYKEEFVAQSVKYTGMELVMRALHENFRHSMQKLVRINPPSGRAALKVLLQEYEIQTVNALIASKATEVLVAETDLMAFDSEQQKLAEKLMLSKSVEELVRKLKGTEYDAVLKAVMPEYGKTQDFRVLTRALNGHYLDKLKMLENGGNGNLLSKLIELRLRSRNLMILLRIKKSDPKADALKFIVSREEKFLKELNRMQEFEKVMERVRQKFHHAAEAVEESLEAGSLIPLEIALEKEFAQSTMRLLKMSVLDFGAILGYMYLKDMEVAAIRKIAYAKQYGFTDELKGMIFSFNA